MNISAVILAGGMGKRLGMDVPKALVGLNGKTLLDYQIEWLNSFGISDIVIAMGYKHKQIISHVKVKGYKGINFSIEKEPLGTAGGLKQAISQTVNDSLVVVNVDDITNIGLNKLIRLGTGTICICRMVSPFGVVHTQDDKIIKFEEKPLLENIWINAGIYFLDKNINLPEKGSLEYDVFPKLSLKALKHHGFRYTFNTQKDIEQLGDIPFFKKISISL